MGTAQLKLDALENHCDVREIIEVSVSHMYTHGATRLSIACFSGDGRTQSHRREVGGQGEDQRARIRGRSPASHREVAGPRSRLRSFSSRETKGTGESKPPINAVIHPEGQLGPRWSGVKHTCSVSFRPVVRTRPVKSRGWKHTLNKPGLRLEEYKQIALRFGSGRGIQSLSPSPQPPAF